MGDCPDGVVHAVDGGNADVSQYVTSIDPYTLAKNAAALPAGVTFDATGKRYVYDGVGATGVTTGHVITATTAAPPVGDATADWLARSTAAGVLVAHDFSVSDDELNNFIRLSGTTNPDPSTLSNPLTLVATPFGSSRAIRSRAIGTTITQATPAGSRFDIQTWHVSNAAHLPDPAGTPYELLAGEPADEGAIQEYVELQSINVAANTISVKRRITSDTMTVNGVTYGGSSNTAPSLPAGWTVGRGPQGSWNRPLCALASGNGKGAPDIGVTNGSARKLTRAWNGARNGTQQATFREGYWGHRYYWDPAAGPAAYRNWTPYDTGQQTQRAEAYEGDEFYLQFRAKVSAERFQAWAGKMFFIQSCDTSGSGQLFWKTGGSRYGEAPPTAQQQAGVQYGMYLVPLTAYDDSAAPAGGVLGSVQGDSMDSGGDPLESQYPACLYRNRPGGSVGSGMYCWCFPADKWVTYLVHMKLGRDNTPDGFQPTPDSGGSNANSSSGLSPPWRSATDANFRTTLEIWAAVEGATQYTLINSVSNYTWFFGDGKYQAGYYYYNPPGLQAFWMSQNLNDYIGGGSLPVPPVPNDILYTQMILSRNFIPCPQV